jgi:hypothetical protein
MDGFLGNTLANLVGTFVGAALALWAALRSTKHAARERDRQLLQSVIDRMYRSRALRRDQYGGLGDSPQDWLDRERCARSVEVTRDRIAASSDGLSAGRPEVAILDNMHAACLRYMSHASRDPYNYVEALNILRAELLDQVEALCDENSTLTRRYPGDGTLETT